MQLKPGSPVNAATLEIRRKQAHRWARQKGRRSDAEDFSSYVVVRAVEAGEYHAFDRIWVDFLRIDRGDTRWRPGAAQAAAVPVPTVDEESEEWPGVVLTGDLGEQEAAVRHYLGELKRARLRSTPHGIMVLTDVLGMEGAEIAKIFGMKEQSVHVTRSEALKLLRSLDR